MTTNEFKEKFPEYSHLEGNELWDAMTEHMASCTQPIDLSKPVYDYMGNQIKEGMIIKIIRTRPFFSEYTPCVLKKGKITQTGETIKFPEKCWKCVGEWKVVKKDNKLYYCVRFNEVETFFHLPMLEFWKQPGDLIAIKGISDIQPN